MSLGKIAIFIALQTVLATSAWASPAAQPTKPTPTLKNTPAVATTTSPASHPEAVTSAAGNSAVPSSSPADNAPAENLSPPDTTTPAASTANDAATPTVADASLAAPGPDGTAVPVGQIVPSEPHAIYGLAMPIVIRPNNPEHAHDYSGIIWYQPDQWVWGKLNVYVAGRFGHWWAKGAHQYRALNIYALAPVLRYYLLKNKWVSPFVEASIGPGYLTRTQFANRNLGMHFTFQDEIGFGAVIGKEAGFYGTLSFLHYSNAALSAHNSGITAPIMLTLGYQFN